MSGFCLWLTGRQLGAKGPLPEKKAIKEHWVDHSLVDCARRLASFEIPGALHVHMEAVLRPLEEILDPCHYRNDSS